MLKSLALIALLSVVLTSATPYPMTSGLGSKYSEVFNGYSVCTDQLFRDIVNKNGYPMQSYRVFTDDGYILKLFRIQAKQTTITEGKRPLLLQHGILDSADNFVINGEANSLAYLLANKGFDVWLSNSRGNKYSRSHRWLNPKSKEFWDFSFHEMGQYDIKANIDTILGKTGKSKLTYIGHSQGTTQMFAALGTEMSGYINNKVDKFIALAPVVLPRHISDPMIARLAADTGLVKATTFLGINELMPGACSSSSFVKWMQNKFCQIASSFCGIFLGFTDDNPWYNNGAITGQIANHFPSGSSLKSIMHFRQLINRQDSEIAKFVHYDYGTEDNKKRYGGNSYPPEYNLGNIKIPVRMYLGKQDKLATVSDNMVLAGVLKQLNKDIKVYQFDNCGHSTFLWAKDFSKIFNDILNELD